MMHTLPLSRVRGLLANVRGLTADDVADRRKRFGTNNIVESVGNPVMELARETARAPMRTGLCGKQRCRSWLGAGEMTLIHSTYCAKLPPKIRFSEITNGNLTRVEQPLMDC